MAEGVDDTEVFSSKDGETDEVKCAYCAETVKDQVKIPSMEVNNSNVNKTSESHNCRNPK